MEEMLIEILIKTSKMKNCIITLLLSLLFLTGFSQNSRFEYTGRLTPAINRTKLNEANFIHEIMPEFGRYFVLPFNERAQFDKLIITIYPQAYFYPKENYNYLFNYANIEISATCDGNLMTSSSTSDTLTTEQKNILNSAELGTEISIKIKFKFKNEANHRFDSADKLKEGEYRVTVIPNKEAEYPGGFKQFTEYLTENVFNKIPEPQSTEKIRQTVLKFTVDEEGQVVNATIAKSSSDPKIDELLLDATNKMPKWMPAYNSKGIKVKQEFSIPLGGGGC